MKSGVVPPGVAPGERKSRPGFFFCPPPRKPPFFRPFSQHITPPYLETEMPPVFFFSMIFPLFAQTDRGPAVDPTSNQHRRPTPRSFRGRPRPVLDALFFFFTHPAGRKGLLWTRRAALSSPRVGRFPTSPCVPPSSPRNRPFFSWEQSIIDCQRPRFSPPLGGCPDHPPLPFFCAHRAVRNGWPSPEVPHVRPPAPPGLVPLATPKTRRPRLQRFLPSQANWTGPIALWLPDAALLCFSLFFFLQVPNPHGAPPRPAQGPRRMPAGVGPPKVCAQPPFRPALPPPYLWEEKVGQRGFCFVKRGPPFSKTAPPPSSPPNKTAPPRTKARAPLLNSAPKQRAVRRPPSSPRILCHFDHPGRPL